PSIKIGQHTIEPTTTHKFLGVLLDQELRFKDHTNYVLAKGERFINQYRRLEKPSKGTTAKHMRRYYLAVAVPRMLYAADIFLVPGTEKARELHKQASQGPTTSVGDKEHMGSYMAHIHARISSRQPAHLWFHNIFHISTGSSITPLIWTYCVGFRDFSMMPAASFLFSCHFSICAASVGIFKSSVIIRHTLMVISFPCITTVHVL
ncbi:hypothetical protein JB92DRAFT_3279219, partial [Gautieria morchelliformis]